jgi:NCS1 family nucleobase:cation symporter-1
MGIPQMIQSRGQFGSYGALIVVVIAAVMYLAFFASNIVLAGQSLHGIADPVPVSGGIVLGALGSGLICVIGYRFIHALNRVATWVLGIGIVLAIGAIFVAGVPADFWSRGGYTTAGFLATVSLAALWQIAFAPYVSDYSRYLPAHVGVRATFNATYLGCTLGSILPFVFGAVVALAMTSDTDVMTGVRDTTGVFGTPLLVLFLLSVISHNALNLYGTVLSMITCVQTFVARWIPTARTRVVLSVAVMVASAYFAIGVSGDFISHFVDIVLALLVVLVPWTAINLIDFYLIHRGNYDLDSIFAADGGIYGRFNGQAILAYVIGILVQIPFMNTPLYAGPVSDHLGGADLSWIIGLVVTGPVYYLLARGRKLAPSELTPVHA